MSETELFLCFGQTLGIKYQTQVSITLSWILSSEWTLSIEENLNVQHRKTF